MWCITHSGMLLFRLTISAVGLEMTALWKTVWHFSARKLSVGLMLMVMQRSFLNWGILKAIYFLSLSTHLLKLLQLPDKSLWHCESYKLETTNLYVQLVFIIGSTVLFSFLQFVVLNQSTVCTCVLLKYTKTTLLSWLTVSFLGKS